MATNPVPASQGQPTGNSTVGSFYSAFEECERQARQRKYQIAEFEDKIENLQKELKDVIEKNKNFEAKCEKMEIEAKSAQTTYQNKLKEKALMENDYRALSKEMDEVSEDILRKKAKLKKVKLFKQEKIDIINNTEEKNLKEYMKNPKIAKMMALKKKSKKLEEIYKQKALEMEQRKKQHKELEEKHAKGWDAFKKKCVKIAEFHFEIKKKMSVLEDVRREYEKTFRTGSLGFQARHTQMNSQLQRPLEPPAKVSSPVSRSGLVMPGTSRRLDGTGSSKLGLVIPFQRRSSTFQQLDRILCQSKTVSESASRRTFSTTPNSAESGERVGKYLSTCSPMKTGSTLVSKIRSKLKGTVYPMRRNQNAQIENANPVPSLCNANDAKVIPAPNSMSNEIHVEKAPIPQLPNPECDPPLQEKADGVGPVPPPNQKEVEIFDSQKSQQVEGNMEVAIGGNDLSQNVELEKNHDLEVGGADRTMFEPAIPAAADPFQPPMPVSVNAAALPPAATAGTSTSSAVSDESMVDLFEGFGAGPSPASGAVSSFNFFESMFTSANPTQLSGTTDFALPTFF